MRERQDVEATQAMLAMWEHIVDFDYEVIRSAVRDDRAIIDVRETYSEKDPLTRKTRTITDTASYTLRRIDGLWYVIPARHGKDPRGVIFPARGRRAHR